MESSNLHETFKQTKRSNKKRKILPPFSIRTFCRYRELGGVNWEGLGPSSVTC